MIKRTKSAKDSASQSNSTLVSVSSASHDPVLDAGTTKSTASRKYIGSLHLSVIYDYLSLLQMAIRH